MRETPKESCDRCGFESVLVEPIHVVLIPGSYCDQQLCASCREITQIRVSYRTLPGAGQSRLVETLVSIETWQENADYVLRRHPAAQIEIVYGEQL